RPFIRVGGKHAWYDHSKPAKLSDAGPRRFNEQLVVVETPVCSIRKSTRCREEGAFTLISAHMCAPMFVKNDVRLLQVGYQDTALLRRCLCGDSPIVLCKELAIVDLGHFPGWIAEHAIETALGEHLWEGQVTVEELILA